MLCGTGAHIEPYGNMCDQDNQHFFLPEYVILGSGPCPGLGPLPGFGFCPGPGQGTSTAGWAIGGRERGWAAGRGISGVRERGTVGQVDTYEFLFSLRDFWPGKEVEVQQRSPGNDCKFSRWQQKSWEA